MIAAEPQAKYYVYAVIDKSTSPAAVLAVRLSRQDARRAMIEAQHIRAGFEQSTGEDMNVSALRVRRAKLTLFET